MGRSRTWQTVLAVVLALGLAACGSGEADSAAPQRSRILTAARETKVIRVPQDQRTIAAAMAAAGPGDMVKLAPGTYRETLVLRAGVKVVGGPSTIDATGLDNGMTADPSVKDASVSGITVQNASLQGININGAEVRLRQVVSRASGIASESSGLLAQNGARVSISECELSGNGGRGLYASFSDVTVGSSRIFDNGAAGIGMEGSTARISMSLMRGNGGVGNVRVSYGSTATLERNQLLDSNNGVGVDAGDDPGDPRPAAATLEGNLIQGNGNHGVAVDHGSSAVLVKNQIQDNGASGIMVRAGFDLAHQLRSSARLEGNTVTGHGGAGLQVFNSDARSEGDRFDGNGFGLLAHFGSAIAASRSSFSSNAALGIWTLDADAYQCVDPDCTALALAQGLVHLRLDHCTVQGNAAWGVALEPGGAAEILASTIQANGLDGLLLNSSFGVDRGDGTAEPIDLPGRATVRRSVIQRNGAWCGEVRGTSSLDLGAGTPGGNSCVANGGGIANVTDPQVLVRAEGNWWGTADGASISAMMFGPVDFVPFLTSAP